MPPRHVVIVGYNRLGMGREDSCVGCKVKLEVASSLYMGFLGIGNHILI